MKVQDIIQSRNDVFSVCEDATVYETARYLRERHVRSVGVLGAAGRLVGAVSQSDISDKVAAENRCPAWMRVSEVMSTDLIVVRPDLPLEECMHLMDEHRLFHLLVEDEARNFLGAISVADLLRVMASHHKERADMFEAFVFAQR